MYYDIIKFYNSKDHRFADCLPIHRKLHIVSQSCLDIEIILYINFSLKIQTKNNEKSLY